jgi:RNA polymerase sigma-70 factor (ECF subfamily)
VTQKVVICTPQIDETSFILIGLPEGGSTVFYWNIQDCALKLENLIQSDTLIAIHLTIQSLTKGLQTSMAAAPKLNADLWVDEYGDALFHFALARVRDKDIAEDLVQETFLAAVKAQAGFKGRSSEKTWLFGILKHKVIDHYRKNKSTIHSQDLFDSPDDLDAFFNAKGGWQTRPAHWQTNPGKVQENKEFLDHFYRCLSDLPPRSADAFVYREIDGLSTQEICVKLSITANNCWVLLYRARMLLRKCLERVGFSRQQEGYEK